MTPPGSSSLEAEGAVIARHLVGAEPNVDWTRRYAASCALVFPQPDEREQQLVDFAMRHRWTLGPLDAALALVRPTSLLHGKVLLASALLEATPQHATLFLPRGVSRSRLAFVLLRCGLVSAASLALGLPLLAVLLLASRRA